MGCAGRVAPVGYRRGVVHTGIWWGDLKEREYLEDLGLGSRLLQWTLVVGFGGTDWIWLRVGTGGELL